MDRSTATHRRDVRGRPHSGRQAALCRVLIAAASADVAASDSCIGGQSALTGNSFVVGSDCLAAVYRLAIESCNVVSCWRNKHGGK